MIRAGAASVYVTLNDGYQLKRTSTYAAISDMQFKMLYFLLGSIPEVEPILPLEPVSRSNSGHKATFPEFL